VLQKDGKDVWALSGDALGQALKSLGRSVGELHLEQDDPDADDLGDGITAPRLIADTHLIPGLWKIDGYGKVAETIKSKLDVTPGVNFFEFPYDWRRDNRVHARRLARESHGWLADWRERSGNRDAKLILICHSMGGLVSRAFLELEGGWKDTRLLLTFGTPYRGSLNALDFLANGMRKQLGPVTLANFTDLVRSFTSVYQLLPIYECLDTGDGGLRRVTEVGALPGVVPDRAAAALAFHRAIRQAVDEHRADPAYSQEGYRIKPLTGSFQPTSQSALLRDGKLETLRTYEGVDQGGDGTVPSVSATPIELSNRDLEVYVREKHASLQNAAFTLDQVIGLLQRQGTDQRRVFAPGGGVSLQLDDAYLVEEHVTVRALPELEPAALTMCLRDVRSGAQVAAAPMHQADDGWHETVMPQLPEGTYRVTVAGDGAIHPVTDVFAVVDEGTDIEAVG
jgi:hypothetical protein